MKNENIKIRVDENGDIESININNKKLIENEVKKAIVGEKGDKGDKGEKGEKRMVQMIPDQCDELEQEICPECGYDPCECETDPPICDNCNGSGEGIADGTVCRVCWGSGTAKGE